VRETALRSELEAYELEQAVRREIESNHAAKLMRHAAGAAVRG
jgi:hypothetical protein